MQYIWSAKNIAFFPIVFKSSYINAGWDLTGAIEIDDLTATEFMNTPPTGKYRGVKDGMPAWLDIPLDDINDTSGRDMPEGAATPEA